MMLVMALHLIGLSVVFSSSLATPLPVHNSMEGSAEEEEFLQLSPTPSLPSTIGSASEHPTTPGGPSHMDKVFLDQVVDFVEENLLLICVASTLLIIILLIVCGSIFMSRRRKVNAYYPSSFPSQMYVDERDKAGGTKPFNELPEKAANAQPTQQTDSGKQLQADIMRAAKKLRTPTKPPPGEREPGPAADQSPEVVQQEHATIPDTDTSHEGEELCQVSHSETAAETSDPEGPVTPPEPEPEPAGLEQDESAQSPSGPGPSQTQQDLGPSSQSHHSDSTPTPPLITGEKTAF